MSEYGKNAKIAQTHLYFTRTGRIYELEQQRRCYFVGIFIFYNFQLKLFELKLTQEEKIGGKNVGIRKKCEIAQISHPYFNRTDRIIEQDQRTRCHFVGSFIFYNFCSKNF